MLRVLFRDPEEARTGFKRTIEDFVCEHCGTKNRGDGYTNHCRSCLFSKHVDIEPGDRSATCSGLMPPVSVETKGDLITLVHRCGECGLERRCRTSADDDWEAIVRISADTVWPTESGDPPKS